MRDQDSTKLGESMDTMLPATLGVDYWHLSDSELSTLVIKGDTEVDKREDQVRGLNAKLRR